MAHKLLPEAYEKPKTEKRIHLPNFNGKFGFSLFIGMKEVFIGIAIGEVEIERVVRKKFIKTNKANVKVYKFD